MSSQTIPDLATANAAKAAAEDARGRALADLETRASEVADIVRGSCFPEGAALRRIPLVRLLSGRPGTSKRHARAVVRQTLAVLGERNRTDRQVDALTIMWVIDARSGGRRIRALADALDPKEQAPWQGFPYAVRAARAETR